MDESSPYRWEKRTASMLSFANACPFFASSTSTHSGRRSSGRCSVNGNCLALIRSSILGEEHGGDTGFGGGLKTNVHKLSTYFLKLFDVSLFLLRNIAVRRFNFLLFLLLWGVQPINPKSWAEAQSKEQRKYIFGDHFEMESYLLLTNNFLPSLNKIHRLTADHWSWSLITYSFFNDLVRRDKVNN